MFAGIGGIDLAFEQNGFKVVWANEIDKYACRTYRLNFSPKILVEDDIRDIDTTKIPNFDVLCAGFPCQAFSSVGLGAGFDDARGTLFFEILRVLKEKKPKAVFLENVSNLLKHDFGKTFDVIQSSLAEVGYSIKYKMMNASDYGVPQQRNRIFIVGFLEKFLCEHFEFPEKVKLKHDAFYYLEKKKQDESYYLDKHKNFAFIRASANNSKKIYRFTDWGISCGRDGICPTLLAAMGSQFERIPFFEDGYSIRKITQRECARLQGFPESFRFDFKAPKQVYKQIGNSVCVPLVGLIAKNMKKTMDLMEASKNESGK